MCGNETAKGLAREGNVHHLVGPEPALGVSRQITRTKRWIDNQHIAVWWNLTSTQRQAQKLISGPSPTADTRLLSFNRRKSRVITGLLTGHNSLRRHLYIMGLIDSPFQKAESSVCTAAHPQKYFGIFEFILEARRPSLRPTHPSIQWAPEAFFRGIKWPGLIQTGTR